MTGGAIRSKRSLTLRKNKSLKNFLALRLGFLGLFPVLALGIAIFWFVENQTLKETERRNREFFYLLQHSVENLLNQTGLIAHQIHWQCLKNPEKELSQDFLDSFLAAYPFIRRIYVANSTGKIIQTAPYEPDLLGNDFNGQEVFYKTQKNQKPFWSDVSISPFTGHPSALLGSPMNQRVLILDADLSSLSGLMASIPGDSRYLSGILDSRGYLIAFHDSETLPSEFKPSGFQQMTSRRKSGI